MSEQQKQGDESGERKRKEPAQKKTQRQKGKQGREDGKGAPKGGGEKKKKGKERHGNPRPNQNQPGGESAQERKQWRRKSVETKELAKSRHAQRPQTMMLYTRMGRATVESAVEPITSYYIETTGRLARANQGRLIGVVSDIMKKHLEEAAEFHREVEVRMMDAIRRHEEMLGVKGEVRERDPTISAKVMSVGAITPSLIKLARNIDRAEDAKEQAVSIGAIEYRPAFDMMSECIIRNRQAKNAMRGIRAFLAKHLGGDRKVDINDLKEYARVSAESRMKNWGKTNQENQEQVAGSGGGQPDASEAAKDQASQSSEVKTGEAEKKKPGTKENTISRGTALLNRLTGRTQ